jgi:hypothetical protein
MLEDSSRELQKVAFNGESTDTMGVLGDERGDEIGIMSNWCGRLKDNILNLEKCGTGQQQQTGDGGDSHTGTDGDSIEEIG